MTLTHFSRARPPTEALLHDLQLHQIELQASNEALLEAQVELEASRDRWADLYESAPVGYFTLDRVGRVLKMNHTGASLLKWQRNAMLNRSFMEFVAPQDRERWGETFCRLRERPLHPLSGAAATPPAISATEVSEFTLVRGDVQFIDVRLDCQRTSGAPDAHSACVRVVVVDVSERKRAQVTMERHRQHLESVLLTQAHELLQATRDAQASQLAKNAFLARMSHEVRTPMNAILGFTHLLRHAQPTKVQAQRLDIVAAAGTQLLLLFNDVLDLASIESGSLTLRCSRFSWLRLMEDLCDELNGLAQDHPPVLVVASEHDVGPFWVWGDALRVRQAWNNLARNALKFTAKGQVVLRAWVVEEGHWEVRVRFEVQDTGIGMTPEQTILLFQAFEQADGSATRQHAGAGLGLTITRRLAELMGGEAGAQSQLGQGSLFWFTARFER